MARLDDRSPIPPPRANVRQTLVVLAGALIPVISLGCPAQFTEANRPDYAAVRVPATEFGATVAPRHADSPVQRVAYQDATSNMSGQGNQREEGRQQEKEAAAQPKQKITLPEAIQMCITQNFRVLAGAGRVRLAEADLLSASLIPNPTLFTDYQLIPLQQADIINQLGPPQADAPLTVPIDWLVFGKRCAAMQAAWLGIDVSSADQQDLVRLQVAATVDAFFEVLMDDAYFKLAEKYLAELEEFEKLTEELAKNKKVGDLELDRAKLAVHEALLERHDRELALELAKIRLRPFLGHTAADPDYEVEGALAVTAVVPPPKLEEALALAEAHRPDLLSAQLESARAGAQVEVERRRGKPKIDVVPGLSYQNQQHINGFRNGSLFDIGVSISLPLTDRNQGNIQKAQAQVQERQFTYQADRADALADAEASVATYSDAVEHLTQFNTSATLKAAHDLRKNMEAAYRAGDRKLIELLDAQKAYRDRLGHVIEFESDYWRALNKLNASVGLN